MLLAYTVIHWQQRQTKVRRTFEGGLLLNFGVKPEFKRLVFDNQRKAERLPVTSNNSVSA